jgi:colanic acid/amylovoran biosynthesis glycosyltransferase
MRIIYVTACMPFGTAEAFVIDEVHQLLGAHQVLIVPRSPGAPGPHGTSLIAHARREGLFSPSVLSTAIRLFVRMPIRVLSSARCLLQTRSPRVAIRNLAILPKALWLAQVASEWNTDHMHCHWAGTTATMTLIASRISGIPWSLTAHRFDIVANNLLSEKAKSASILRVISEDGKKMLLERGVKANGKLHVLPMGVTIPPQCSFKSPKDAVFLCPANLLEVKGHRYLLQAWRLLQDRGIQGELWLAGEGELRDTLTQLTKNLAITSTVKFLSTVAHSSLLDLYAKGRISAVVLASVDLGHGCHEGIPVSLVEAMSYGIPVIATNTGGIPELIEPGTGVLVPACDPVALADAIERILTDEPFAELVGERGRRHIIETRNVVSVAASLEAWFRGDANDSVPTLGRESEAPV